MRRFWPAAALVASLALAPALAPRAASATTVVSVTVEELARRSDEVLVATPRAATSQWVGQMIVTDYDLEVQSVVQGRVAAQSHVTLRLPGGTVGRIGQRVPGVPSPQIDQPYLVFLKRATDVPGVYYVTHLTASVLPMTSDGSGGVVVQPAPEGMVTHVTGPTGPATPVTVMVRAGVPLEQLTRALRGAR